MYKRKPDYSVKPRDAGMQGVVLLSLVVGTDGVPRDIRVVRPLRYDLDQNAIHTLSTWRFTPAKKKGKPVPVEAGVRLDFRLLESPRKYDLARHSRFSLRFQAG